MKAITSDQPWDQQAADRPHWQQFSLFIYSHHAMPSPSKHLTISPSHYLTSSTFHYHTSSPPHHHPTISSSHPHTISLSHFQPSSSSHGLTIQSLTTLLSDTMFNELCTVNCRVFINTTFIYESFGIILAWFLCEWLQRPGHQIAFVLCLG